ncbi:MAG: HD domain-containing protein [Candidatus Omnitrophica bacterium]|nr:HD domain-containing protein [Candidatus Omnitrophota bacterium]
MVKKNIIVFIVNLLIFSGLAYAYAQDFNPKPLCLSPQLQLQTSDMVAMCQAMYQQVDFMLQPEITLQGNHDYSVFLEKLSKQVGSADDLMDYILSKYAHKYGHAIKLLEAREAQIPEKYQWVIDHQKEVMLISYCMGKILGFSEEHLAQIAIGGRFHDIGKCEINIEIINDDRVFSDIRQFTMAQQEMIHNEIVEHSVKSEDILKECGITDPLIFSIAFYHHANFDGSGYPSLVNRQMIPLEAKIARVADSFSAMLGFRPYNHRFKHSFASAVADI